MTKFNDRYAESVICNPGNYDAVEIHGVRGLNAAGHLDRSQCEIDDARPEYYSVYVHLRLGGVECIGDFSDLSDAKQYAAEVAAAHAWSVYDYTDGAATATSGFCIVADTLLSGIEPAEIGGDDRPVIYSTLQEAQQSIAENIIDRLLEFLGGERDFDNAMSCDDCIIDVDVWSDGYITWEGGELWTANSLSS